MKYLDYAVTLSEFPDEIALCINISNCPFHCPGCHSPELWEDIGNTLDKSSLSKLIESNKGVSCIGLMGGDLDPIKISDLAAFIKFKYPNLKVGWYSGNKEISSLIKTDWFDYIKVGPYIKELGGLDNPNTNQKFYAKGKHLHKIDANDEMLYDVTYKFWKHG